MGKEQRMNEAAGASATLLRLAQQHVNIYALLPGVQAIVVTGSVAAGYADHYSDIDTLIYYDELPPQDAITAASERAGGSNGGLYGRDEDSSAEYYYVHGVKCEFAHATVKSWEQIISSVVEQYDTDPIKQKMLSSFAEAVPLYGAPLVQCWKDRIASYPDELAVAIVKNNLRFHSLSVIEKRIAERDGLLFVHELLLNMEKSLLGVLFALNHMYNPNEWKRMDWWLGKLTIAPEQLSARLKSALLSEPTPALHSFGELANETLDLVDAHMPQVDTKPVREEMHYQQEAWTAIF